MKRNLDGSGASRISYGIGTQVYNSHKKQGGELEDRSALLRLKRQRQD